MKFYPNKKGWRGYGQVLTMLKEGGGGGSTTSFEVVVTHEVEI